jgi:hypothetical protein
MVSEPIRWKEKLKINPPYQDRPGMPEVGLD